MFRCPTAQGRLLHRVRKDQDTQVFGRRCAVIRLKLQPLVSGTALVVAVAMLVASCSFSANTAHPAKHLIGSPSDHPPRRRAPLPSLGATRGVELLAPTQGQGDRRLPTVYVKAGQLAFALACNGPGVVKVSGFGSRGTGFFTQQPCTGDVVFHSTFPNMPSGKDTFTVFASKDTRWEVEITNRPSS